MTSSRANWRSSTVGGSFLAPPPLHHTGGRHVSSPGFAGYASSGATSSSVLPKRKTTAANCSTMLHSAMRELARPMLAQLSAPGGGVIPHSAFGGNPRRVARSLSPATAAATISMMHDYAGTTLDDGDASPPHHCVPTVFSASVGGISPASAGECPTGAAASAPLYRCASDRISSKTLERSTSVHGSNGPNRAGFGANEIALLPGLSPSQVLTIRRSWKHINTKGLHEVVKRCFQKLERNRSVVLAAFIAIDNPMSLAPSTSHNAIAQSNTVTPNTNNGGNAATRYIGLTRQAAASNQTGSSKAGLHRQQAADRHPTVSPPVSPSDGRINTNTSAISQSKSNAQLTQSASTGDAPVLPLPNATSGGVRATNVCAPAPTVRNVTRYFLGLLQRIVDSEPDVDMELKRIGARHVAVYEYCGVGVPEIERLGEILADAFFKLDGIRQSKETTRAWRMLIAKIVDHIRDGFETEMRFQRRKTSAYQHHQQQLQQNNYLRPKSSSSSTTAYGNDGFQHQLSGSGGMLSPSATSTLIDGSDVGGYAGWQQQSQCGNNLNSRRSSRSNYSGNNNDDDNSGDGTVESRRNSMPSSRKTSLRVEIEQVTRKLSNIK